MLKRSHSRRHPCRRSRVGSRDRCCPRRVRSRSGSGRRRLSLASRARAGGRAGAFVCTITGTPVSSAAAAIRRRILGMSPTRPCSSTAHFRNAALTPVSSISSRISRTNSSTSWSSVLAIRGRSPEAEERVDAGADDDVEVDLGVDALDPRDVAAETDCRRVDDAWIPPARSRWSFAIASATRTSSSQMFSPQTRP